jgi:hypothetical protein
VQRTVQSRRDHRHKPSNRRATTHRAQLRAFWLMCPRFVLFSELHLWPCQSVDPAPKIPDMPRSPPSDLPRTVIIFWIYDSSAHAPPPCCTCMSRTSSCYLRHVNLSQCHISPTGHPIGFNPLSIQIAKETGPHLSTRTSRVRPGSSTRFSQPGQLVIHLDHQGNRPTFVNPN